MANSLLDSPPQFPAAGPWGSLFAVQEPGKPRQEDETEEVDQQRQEECVVPKYVRRERCLKVESGATAARCSIKWEQEQTAAFWVATT
ncbi:unnamed protein product [Triticum turgidum subsp. durum]|uniref:Uncharacterized protein n=1 Tax=Triticum turgidum subsp. durum TaxID=4567 RepID=A0A9R0QZ12_TRITD|nr:unnamed protein product [Triticum turgidum subsp. durum]